MMFYEVECMNCGGGVGKRIEEVEGVYGTLCDLLLSFSFDGRSTIRSDHFWRIECIVYVN